MMRRDTYNNIVKTARLLSLVVLMAFGAGLKGWGQSYTILPQVGKDFPQENVPTLVDTFFIRQNEKRTLQSPNYDKYWYFRWYRMNDEGNPTKEKLFIDRNSVLRETSNEDSFFWFYGLLSDRSYGASEKLSASQISYEGLGSPDSVYLDLSFYVDGVENINNVGNTFNEPTIGKRYKFIFRDASEISERLNQVGEDEALKTTYITVPKDANTINLQMDMKPENYYWGTNATNQGSDFEIEGLNNWQYAIVNNLLIRVTKSIKEETVIKVYAKTIDDNKSPCIVKFVLVPQENCGFLKDEDTNLIEFRHPEKYPEKYEQVGVVDFDYGTKETPGVIPFRSLTKNNNMSSIPIPPENTSYSFANPLIPWINYDRELQEDAYGLYRTANIKGISERDDSGDGWVEYTRTSSRWGGYYSFVEGTKHYGWYYTKISEISGKKVYDRTYYNTNHDSIGYFCYVNASTEAGSIAKVEINGVICSNTELIISAWLADITDATTVPNINLVLRGENELTGKSEILHFFSSGDMVLENNNNSDRANWKQLCYKIRINNPNISSYTKFFMEIQNNTHNTSGADYAIDDIRVYRTLPNIRVRRENACNASTLLISSDYETILRNMGWERGELVADTTRYDYKDLEYRKYRYGLMGTDHQFKNSIVGNVYFAFYDSTQTDEEDRWVTVNKRALDVSVNAAKSIRVPVSSVMSIGNGNDNNGYEFYTEDREMALINEQLMNLRAVIDYNNDIALWMQQNEEIADVNMKHSVIDTSGIGIPGTEKFNADLYQSAIETMYHRLNIPRLRCPWYNPGEEGGRLYLSIIDVDNTDLKYRGQGKTDEYPNGATGAYQVISFRADQLVQQDGVINPEEPCTLKSDFIVQPAATLQIETSMGEPQTAACAGSLRKITATLDFYDDEGNPIDPDEKNINYLFDWYLADSTSYAKFTEDNGKSIQEILEAYRNDMEDTDVITIEEVNVWDGDYLGSSAQTCLIQLLENGSLMTGSQGGSSFDLILPDTNKIVAIPYVFAEDRETASQYTFCSDCSQLTLPIAEIDIPKIQAGIPGVQYPFVDSAPLRLGLRNIEGEKTLELPVGTQDLFMSNEATHLGLIDNEGVELSFRMSETAAELTPVGKVKELYIPKNYTENHEEIAYITIVWNVNAAQYFKEGSYYDLFFPFVQYKGSNLLSSQCDGLASFRIKIVPEYLTWQGDGSGVWYNDESSWTISTKEELYFEKKNVTNGTERANSFSPLYFTKITIPDGMELPLYDEASQNSIQNNQPLNFSSMEITSGTTSNIEYDMAVYSVDGGNSVSVKPYYGNLVSEIYFKPKALLKNQQYLNYEKAWVEFEMEKGKKYWLSSPLKDVFAGDMYAPTGTGRQTTPAFADITYTDKTDGGNYDRWNPAFYQKAWDKGVTYYTDENGSDAGKKTISAVQSNWSIEYNDVNVPYSLGKGFYASVEGDFENDKALVRLPKADNNYSYYTKAASTIETRSNAGELAGNEPIIITLIDSDEKNTWGDNNEYADGDGKHFLLGNPYMYPLDVEKFFSGNLKEGFSGESVFAPKYWILQDGTSTATVGTPDVGFGEDTGTIGDLGQIPPMTAFFVELNDSLDADASLKVTFTTDMMADNAETTRRVETKSLTASNPILTLAAERGETRSVARLLTSDKGHDAYEASEDAVILLDSELDAPMVYTVAGDVAAQFNTMQSIKNVPLGVYADKGEEVELTIRGISQFAEKLYLYDAVTKQSTPLDDDSYTFRVTGPSHGRFTLTSQNRISAESDICVYSPTPRQLLVLSAPEEPLQRVQVYDMSGRMVTSRDNIRNTTCQLTVPSGIYVVYAENETGNVRVKVRVR